MKTTATTYWDMTHDRMIRGVVSFCQDDANVAVTNSIPAFAGYILGLKNNMDIVQTLRTSIALPTTGYASQNDSLRSSISIIGARIMDAAYSYALDTNNDFLAGQMKTSASAQVRMKFGMLIGFSQAAIDAVNAVLSSLTTYGVAPVAVSAWQGLVNQLSSQLSDPNGAIAFRKSVNEQIQNVLRDCMLSLHNNCDRVSKQFAAANAGYLANYKAVRKLKPSTLSTQARVHVKDVNGNPVVSGEVFIIGTDAMGTLDSEGYALVDHIPFGSQQMSVTTPFGSFSYGPFDFKKGKSLTLHIQVPTTPSAKPVVMSVKEEVITETVRK